MKLFFWFLSCSPLRYHLSLVRHEEVPLQTVISLKTINKSSVGNSDKIVGYELELQKTQEWEQKESLVWISKNLWNYQLIGQDRCQNKTRKRATKHILVMKPQKLIKDEEVMDKRGWSLMGKVPHIGPFSKVRPLKLLLDMYPVLPRMRDFRPWRPKIPLPYPRKQIRITELNNWCWLK